MKDKREQTQLIVANKEIRETRFGEFFNLDAEALWEENQKYSFFKRKRSPSSAKTLLYKRSHAQWDRGIRFSGRFEADGHDFLQ